MLTTRLKVLQEFFTLVESKTRREDRLHVAVGSRARRRRPRHLTPKVNGGTRVSIFHATTEGGASSTLVTPLNF